MHASYVVLNSTISRDLRMWSADLSTFYILMNSSEYITSMQLTSMLTLDQNTYRPDILITPLAVNPSQSFDFANNAIEISMNKFPDGRLALCTYSRAQV